MKTFSLALVFLSLMAGTAMASHEEFALDRQVAKFKPNRDDVTISKAVLVFRCLQKPDGQGAYKKCAQFMINSKEAEDAYHYMELRRIGINEFELDSKHIGFSTANEGYFCMAVKVFLNEVPHQCDSDFYVNREERYSLVTFCTAEKHPNWTTGHMFNFFNRARTIKGFLDKLSRPIDIRFKPGPLPVCRK